MDIIDSKFKILQIDTVDFTDASAVSDFGHVLLSAYRNARGFASGKGKKLLEIERIAQQYVSKVADQMSGASANDIIRLFMQKITIKVIISYHERNSFDPL